MRGNSDTIYREEFIGAPMEVIESTHDGYRGLSGTVVDESKKTLTIENDGKKILPKKGNKFKIMIDDRERILEGNKIRYRPEDRTKRLG